MEVREAEGEEEGEGGRRNERADLCRLFSVHPHGFLREVFGLASDSIRESLLPRGSSFSSKLLGHLLVPRRERRKKEQREGRKKVSSTRFLPLLPSLLSDGLYTFREDLNLLDLPLGHRIHPFRLGKHFPLGFDSPSKLQRRRGRELSTDPQR